MVFHKTKDPPLILVQIGESLKNINNCPVISNMHFYNLSYKVLVFFYETNKFKKNN